MSITVWRMHTVWCEGYNLKSTAQRYCLRFFVVGPSIDCESVEDVAAGSPWTREAASSEAATVRSS